MGFVIATQTPEHVFLGGRPDTFEQCCSKIELVFGYSLKNKHPMGMQPDPLIRHTIRTLNPGDIPFANIF